MKLKYSKITDKWIKEKRPCLSAMEWWDKQERDSLTILNKLIKEKHYDWANWLIVRIMHKHDYVSYAIYAAEQVIDIYEKKYPDDKRPRKAIEAAKKYLKNPSIKTRTAAAAAAYAAYTAADDDTYAAAYVAASFAAAHAAAAAYAAAYTAANDDTYTAAYTAAYTADKQKIQLKILNYGMKLLEDGK
jgi:hypothetical protein